MSGFKQQLDNYFDKFHEFFDEEVPKIVANSATEHFKERFSKKGWDGKKWPALSKKYKPKRGSMMVRSGALVGSIRPTLESKELVIVEAGSSKVPYAKAHNEGESIYHAAKSETFVRNRHKTGKKGKMFGGMGAFKKGTTPGKGLTFKAYTVKMPKRQFMGYSKGLYELITKRITNHIKQ